ncbi:MAG: DoxX family protein [Sphingobacteriales bacterium]|nr:MAG: DoxX family protein [Sphingobacteriales bacterium]
MKKINVLYWVFTSLFCFFMLGSAIPDILVSPMAVQGIHGDLGYPVYFIPFIGIAKALGVLALLLPISPRLKEWAWAGLFFDLTGAIYSVAAIGKPDAFFMLLPLSVGIVAYVFYRKRQARQKAGTSNSERAATLLAA